MMKISEQGLEFIGKNEGLKLKRYKDSAGLDTIGVGHLITGKESPSIGNTISFDRAMELLNSDCQSAITRVNLCILPILKQYEFDALVDFCFNIGIGAFTNSTLVKKLNDKDRLGAAEEFAKWNKAGGKVVAGLVERRKREVSLFKDGIYG